MTPRRALVAALIAVPLALAGAAGATSPPQPATASALAALITAKGLGCSDFTATSTGSTTITGGTCTVGHEFDVSLAVFRSRAGLAKNLPVGEKNICAALKSAHSSQKTVLVVGPNWVAIFESQVNANMLAKPFRAKTVTLAC